MLDRATSASDFRLAEVRRRRIAIYIRVAPGALARLAPVLRLFFEQFVQANTETPFGPETGNTVPVLLMLDEFPALGRARAMENAIAYMASYGLRCCIVAQSESQLRAVYGEDGARTLISNCANPNLLRSSGCRRGSSAVRGVGFRTRSTADPIPASRPAFREFAVRFGHTRRTAAAAAA